MKKFAGLTIALWIASGSMLAAEELWILSMDTMECAPPPTIKGVEITPRVVMKTATGCKIDTAGDNDEIILVTCKDPNTTLLYATSFKACNQAKKVLIQNGIKKKK